MNSDGEETESCGKVVSKKENKLINKDQVEKGIERQKKEKTKDRRMKRWGWNCHKLTALVL